MKRPRYVIIVVTVLTTLHGTALADFDPNKLVDSTNAFLIRQMEVFDSVRPTDQPPLVQTYGWDLAVSFPPADLNLPSCCNLPCASAPLWQMAYRGDIYDQSLAACWFTERARLDFANGSNGTENFTRAQRLLDAVIFLRDHDPNGDGRVRTAYWANNLLNLAGTEASVMDPGVGVGNMAYFGIALTRFYYVAKVTSYLDDPNRQEYLEAAKETADWILEHCTDDNWPCGFTGGYEGWAQTKFTWKSTEHNIDVFVFASNLYYLTGNQKWKQMAERAACLLSHLYVDVGGQCGYYLTGTLADGNAPNHTPLPADAQAWTTLARCNDLRIDTDERATCAMQWVLQNLKDRCDCDVTTLPNDGIRFSNLGKNVQCEITASAAFALLWLDEETSQAGEFLELLDWIRLNAAPPYDNIQDGNGIAATPCPEGAWTGYGEYAWYYNLLHVASSTWAGSVCLYLAHGEKTANPLIPLSCNNAPIANAGDDQTVSAGLYCTTEITLDGSDSNDTDGDPLTYRWTWAIDANTYDANGVSPTVELPPGEHNVKLIVNDGYQDSEPDYVMITIDDDTPPELIVSVTSHTLWPPNHKMVLITPTLIVSDNCDESPDVSLIDITMNEGGKTSTVDLARNTAPRVGHVGDDIQIGDNGSIYLRAERSGTSSGRIYTITYQAVDDSGNVTAAAATVTVPHSRPQRPKAMEELETVGLQAFSLRPFLLFRRPTKKGLPER